jgi:hypothetical protein
LWHSCFHCTIIFVVASAPSLHLQGALGIEPRDSARYKMGTCHVIYVSDGNGFWKLSLCVCARLAISLPLPYCGYLYPYLLFFFRFRSALGSGSSLIFLHILNQVTCMFDCNPYVFVTKGTINSWISGCVVCPVHTFRA